MLENGILLIVGLVGLYFGGEWLVMGASRLARSFGIPALIVGLTVVSFGTSAPELLVSLDAALRGISDISIGNVVGSNIANIGLILGLSALVYPVAVRTELLRREIPIMIAVSILAFLLFMEGQIGRRDGFILLAGFVVFMVITVRSAIIARRNNGAFAAEEAELEAEEEPIIPASRRLFEVGRVLLGLAVLVVGARLTVDNAVILARSVGVSELVIGVTLVAVGTSLPELATSVIAAFRHQSDIAIGNIVGSNIFNLLLILGATAAITPINVAPRIIQVEGVVMLVFTALIWPLSLNKVLSRREGLLFVTLYIAFIAYTFLVMPS